MNDLEYQKTEKEIKEYLESIEKNSKHYDALFVDRNSLSSNHLYIDRENKYFNISINDIGKIDKKEISKNEMIENLINSEKSYHLKNWNLMNEKEYNSWHLKTNQPDLYRSELEKADKIIKRDNPSNFEQFKNIYIDRNRTELEKQNFSNLSKEQLQQFEKNLKTIYDDVSQNKNLNIDNKSIRDFKKHQKETKEKFVHFERERVR